MTTAIQKFEQLLATNIQQIRNVLPDGMDERRLCRMAINACVRNPRLIECNAESFYLATVNAAETGLFPGVLQQAAFVPYKGIVQFQVMYQGLIELARRSGQLATIYAQVVRDGDLFDYEHGLHPKLVHKPDPDNEENPWTHVYAVAHLKDESFQFDVMSRTQVMKVKARSQSANASHSPWQSDEEEMAKKTILKRLLKMLPKSVEMANAIELDNRAENDMPPTSPTAPDLAPATEETPRTAAGVPEVREPKFDDEPAHRMPKDTKTGADLIAKIEKVAATKAVTYRKVMRSLNLDVELDLGLIEDIETLEEIYDGIRVA